MTHVERTAREQLEAMLAACKTRLKVVTEPVGIAGVCISASSSFHDGTALFEFDVEGNLVDVSGSDEGMDP